MLEEYSPKLIYVEGSKNVTVDTLSILDIVDTLDPAKNNIKSLNEHYGLEDKDFHALLIIKPLCKINRKIKN